MLMENWYRRKDAWLRARPAVCRALMRASRALTLLVYAVYIGCMALLLAEAIAGVRPWQQLIRFVLVPAVTFLTGSALMRCCSCRPLPTRIPAAKAFPAAMCSARR